MQEIGFAEPQILLVGGSDAGVDVAGNSERLSASEETDVFTHDGAVSATNAVEPTISVRFSDLLTHRAMDDEEGATSSGTSDERVGRIVGSAGEPIMAVGVLKPIKDGGSRNTAISAHSVVVGFTLGEGETADNGAGLLVGDGEELVKGAGFKTHVGVDHEKPVAVGGEELGDELVSAFGNTAGSTFDRCPARQPMVMPHIPTNQVDQGFVK